MLAIEHVFWLLAVLSLAYFWWRSMGIRNLALANIHERLAQNQLQLLDQSLVLEKIRMRRQNGWLRVYRQYSFEFSSTGDQRYQGRICMVGERMLSLDLDVHLLQ